MPQTVELVRVKTTLGDRVYPLDTRVYSNVGGKNLFFHESVGDLTGNEMILWHNESIEKKLEDIEPYLLQSPRYQKAEQTVYATNSSGQKIPQLRIQLIKALAAKGIVTAESPQDLEQRIMLEQGKDFTPHEYSAMADFVYQGMQQIGKKDNAPTRSEAQIREWLHGKTLGPQNPNILYSLAIATGSPVFEDWFVKASDTAKSSSGFWGEYKFYTVLRQTIMRYLARGKGELKGKISDNGNSDTEAQNGHRKESLDMTPEIQIVLHQFMEEINEEFSLARVVGVEKVPMKLANYRQQKMQPQPHLAKGAYTGDMPEGVSAVSLESLLMEWGLLTQIAGYVFENYIQGSWNGTYSPELPLGKLHTGYIVSASAHPLLTKSLVQGALLNVSNELGLTLLRTDKTALAGPLKGVTDTSGIINIHGLVLRLIGESGTPLNSEEIKALFRPLTEAIVSGQMDKALGIEPMTTYTMLQRVSKLNNSVPSSYRDMMFFLDELKNPDLDRQTRRDVQNRYTKVHDKIAHKYGIAFEVPKYLAAEALEELYIDEIQEHWTGEGSVWPIFEKYKNTFVKLRDPVYLRWAAAANSEFFHEGGITFLTQAEVLELLQKHGLTALMKFIPEANFALDPKPDPDPQPLETVVAEAAAAEAAEPTVVAGGAA